jgi:hypothetical protein
MSYQAVDGVDYMADEQEMADLGNEFADENYVREGGLGLDEYHMVVSLLLLIAMFRLSVFPLHWQFLNSFHLWIRAAYQCDWYLGHPSQAGKGYSRYSMGQTEHNEG